MNTSLILNTPLRRWWQHLGFGIESRTDYDFLHEVILERAPYYIYEEMRYAFPHTTRRQQRTAQLLFRLGNHFKPKEILYYGMPTDLNRFALSHTITTSDTSTTILYVEKEPGEDLHRYLSIISAAIITDIDNVNKSLWQNVVKHPHSITFDMGHMGIAIIDRKRFSQHYNI